jgi:CrcB protein
MTLLSLAIGGMLGAICRYLVSLKIQGIKGILLINWFGSLLMGISIFFAFENIEWQHFWLVGFLGAFTTFSTFAVQVIECWLTGKHKLAIMYALFTLIGGYLFVCLGWWISSFWV